MTTHRPLDSPLPTVAGELDDCYDLFYDAVATAQVAQWAPVEPSRVLDLSGDDDRFARLLLQLGHEVVQVRSAPTGPGTPEPGLLTVVADGRRPDFLADASVDAVLAEGRTLSQQLGLESVVAELRRVLRPSGRLLLVVESLNAGLARLADQGRWAELADLPHADVVLVPADPTDPDGAITRCFWPEEVTALLTGAGFEVDGVRPRTVLSPATVERAVRDGGAEALGTLVRTELQLSAEREGEAGGRHLVACARRPPA